MAKLNDLREQICEAIFMNEMIFINSLKLLSFLFIHNDFFIEREMIIIHIFNCYNFVRKDRGIIQLSFKNLIFSQYCVYFFQRYFYIILKGS